MFDFFKTMSRIFAVLAIISALLLIPVVVYLHDYQLEFDLNKHPVVMLSILGLLILQPFVFICLAVLTRSIAKNLFDYDLNIEKRIKDYCKKETLNP